MTCYFIQPELPLHESHYKYIHKCAAEVPMPCDLCDLFLLNRVVWLLHWACRASGIAAHFIRCFPRERGIRGPADLSMERLQWMCSGNLGPYRRD